MRKVRAPDPTLASFPRDNEDGDLHTVAVTGLGDSGVPLAHRERGGLPPVHPCRDVGWSPTPRLTVEQAAYVAVPCRECFPDAPPPGREYATSNEDRWFAIYVEQVDPDDGPLTVSGPYLGWQRPAEVSS